MPLPYRNATSSKAATENMHKILVAFGAQAFGVMEDVQEGKVTVKFEYRGRKVLIAASSKDYAAAWLNVHPHGPRMKASKIEYERRALQQGQMAIYSILRDWIKGQVTAIEVGMLSFEDAFLGQILLADGETVLERVTSLNILAPPAQTVA